MTSSTRGPGGVGSYLARQEFGSSEVLSSSLFGTNHHNHRHQHHQHHHQVAGQPGPDSGYVSHSSGGGYPKLQVDHYDDFHDEDDICFGT